MIAARLIQFRVILAFTIVLGLSVTAYIAWATYSFNSNHALTESQYLSKFTSRAQSRIFANPDWFQSNDLRAAQPIGNERIGYLFSYSELLARFPQVSEIDYFPRDKAIALLLKYRGVFKAPNYLLVRAVHINDKPQHFTYLLVEDRFNGVELDMHILEKAMPAIVIALISIFMLILVELFHINKVNSTVTRFSRWASELKAGRKLEKRPDFSSSKLNYMAFTIDKSLSGISDALEKEQSFARFTSHELRTSIAVLSANLEVLELMMKDLTDKEKSVLQNMDSAVSDMKYQMEALLWLSREGDRDVEIERFSLREMVHKSLSDNSYLAENKLVDVAVNGGEGWIRSNPVMVQIITNNLIRNALQNTRSGSLTIDINNFILVISNVDRGDAEEIKKDVGFGIGLVLVEKLVSKLGLGYTVEQQVGGRKVTLTFI